MNKLYCFFLFLVFSLNATTEEIITFSAVPLSHSTKTHEPLWIELEKEDLSDYLINECITKITKGLEQGKQICFIAPEKKKDISASFSLIFKSDKNTLSWKLYDHVSHQYLEGKEYKVAKKNASLARAICKDIWIALFEDPTPFDALLAYIKKTKGLSSRPLYEICITSPLVQDSSKTILKTTRPLVDLTSAGTALDAFLVYSEVTAHNVRMLKITQNGIVIPLVDTKGTNASFTSTTDLSESFYIHSGAIYTYFYDPLQQAIHHLPFIQYASPCASPVIGDNNQLFYTYNGKVYCCIYDPVKHIPVRSYVISSGYALSPAFCTHTQTVVFTEKIGSYMQLVSHDIKTKTNTVLTQSLYHKEDPALSPCGTYIAYVAHDQKNNKNVIEILNIYTGAVLTITHESEDCFSPCWLSKPL